MTREEISVLSSARRDNVRRRLEEVERYKRNPLLYILNPRVQVRKKASHKAFLTATSQEWISRQRLMLFFLFVNLSLAFMFFKLLT